MMGFSMFVIAALIPDTVAYLKELFSNIQFNQWLIAYLVLLIPVIISWSIQLHIHKELLSASLRATLQLVLIAVILFPIFNSTLFVQILLLVVMMIAGAVITLERGKEIKHAFWISLFSIFVSYSIIISIFIITKSLDVIPNIIIPISGMLIGNATRTISLNYHKAMKDFKTYQSTVEAMMIDGATKAEALRIPQRETLTNAIVPKIDSLKTLGIVHIPGAMAGMMIAGAHPIEAAGYQILIFFGIVSIASLSTIIANNLAYKSIFNSHYPHLNKHSAIREK